MIKLYICCLVLIIGSVEVGPDIDMKFHQEVMEIVSYDTFITNKRLKRRTRVGVKKEEDAKLGKQKVKMKKKINKI